MGTTDFKASNGWLASFKSRHNIVGIKLCGESASVSLETVDEWKGRLPSLLEDYKAENVFNLDETGLFFRATPDRSLAVKGSDCHGGKRSKDRLTVALACSMTGEVLKPLVIGRAAKPRCFRNLDITRLPVTYKNNRKSWMTSTLFDEWLNDINKKMRLAGRHILLFLDNAACHSANLVLSHVTLQFFPPNTTSKLQPLDQGIIQAFKVYYRHRLLHRLVAAVSAPDSTPTSVSQAVSVLDACHWIAAATRELKPETIANCFAHAGFPVKAISQEPLLSPQVELSPVLSSISNALQLQDPLTFSEYNNMDSCAPATEELSTNWCQELLSDHLASKDEGASGGIADGTEEEEEEDDDAASEPLQISSFQTALFWMRQLKVFSSEKNLPELLDLCGKGEDLLSSEAVRGSNHKQTNITDFFRPNNG